MNLNSARTMSSILGLTAFVALAPAPAFAQAADEGETLNTEIVVTAQRRAERSVDVPITVTTLGQDTLATANVQDLSDISRVTPSLRFDTTGAFSQPTIRGIGTSITTKAFIMIMIGGAGVVGGSILGAIVLGFAEAIGYALLPGSVTYLVIFVVLILFLILRPQGIMGKPWG